MLAQQVTHRLSRRRSDSVGIRVRCSSTRESGQVITNPGRTARELADWAKQLEARASRFDELHTRMSALAVTEQSADGSVRVTVDSNGLPTELTLTRRSQGHSPAHLSVELMACLRRAQAGLRSRVEDMTRAVVGPDEAADRILARYADRFPDPAGPEPRPVQAHHYPIGTIDEV
jgi:hypothetical protein